MRKVVYLILYLFYMLKTKITILGKSRPALLAFVLTLINEILSSFVAIAMRAVGT